jgi:hypothetical protein
VTIWIGFPVQALPPPVKKFFPFHLGSSWQLDFDFSSGSACWRFGFSRQIFAGCTGAACCVSYSFSCSDFLVSTEGLFCRSIRFSVHFGASFPGCIAARVFTDASSLLLFFISRARRSFRGLIRAHRDSPDPASAVGARPHYARSRFHSCAACVLVAHCASY